MISIVKHVSIHLKSLKFCQYIFCYLYSHFPHCLYEKVYSCVHGKTSFSVFPALRRKHCSCVEARAGMHCSGKMHLLVMVPVQVTVRNLIL